MTTLSSQSTIDADTCAQLPLTPRIERLHAALLARFAENPESHRLVDAEAGKAHAESVIRAYEATPELPPIRRRARVLQDFADTFPIAPEPDALLAGCQTFNSAPWPAELRERAGQLGWSTTTGHIVHDYQAMLTHGPTDLLAHVGRHPPSPANLAFQEALSAFIAFIQRQAAALPHLSGQLLPLLEGSPQTFRQAVQLTWLAHLFLHVENPTAAISFGRADQYLWPFLARDLEQGLPLEDAFETACAFFLRCCEGCESQNLLLGGVDSSGQDATNPLSYLMLAAMAQLKTFQPSLCVRLHPHTPDSFLEAACRLARQGTGQPGFINDNAAIPALQQLGVSLTDARNYAIVGCYEATVQGGAYPNTVAGSLHLVRELNAYLETATARGAAGLSELVAGLLDHLQASLTRQQAEVWQPRWNHWQEHAPSPFGSVLMRNCVESGLPLEAGGAPHSFFGVNMLGLGTLVDSLRVIQNLVYEQRLLTVAELAAAVRRNFPDENMRQRCLSIGNRYGTNAEVTNRLAGKLSRALADRVLAMEMAHGVRPYPAFFWFLADVRQLDMASPDGRRAGDLISYGVGPAGYTVASPTAVLASAAHVAHDRCGCGNPLALHLGHDVPTDVLISLLRTYFRAGGFHLHVNLIDAETLREAQRHPERYAALTVRISGYSARFTHLDRRLQDALIQRAATGV